MRHLVTFCFCLYIFTISLYCQELQKNNSQILFHGMVVDSDTQTPLSGTQIFIDRAFYSVSDNEGKFAFFVSQKDTVIFNRLGFKPTRFIIGDTLAGREFIAGVFMHSDTISIGEVIIVPRLNNLRSQMLAPRSPDSREIENARYNLAVSAYQGRVGQGKLGDPASNYQVLKQKQSYEAYTKGQIPSDRIIGLSPLLLIPAAYLLINGLPEKPQPLQPRLTDQEISEIHKKYLESVSRKNR